ncbi:MAG: hypothetical protein EXS49_02110 [Candidatus Pacebacteria bacterium]|nr:hypothetical protein [Candidatus Paceibacterota bacterium]
MGYVTKQGLKSMGKPIKSEFLSAFGIAFGIWKSLVDAVKNEGGGDEELRCIESNPRLREQLAKLIVGEKKTEQILQLVGEMIELPGSTEYFVAREHFVVGSKKAGVPKIVVIGGNFTNWMLVKNENPIGPTVLRRRKLLKWSLSGPILNELGGEAKAETTLQEIFSLLKLQPNGEYGSLLTNGYANIFYVCDAKGELCPVYVGWHGGGWAVHAGSVTDPYEWCEGYQVFSRD